jgi:hypothetical protein
MIVIERLQNQLRRLMRGFAQAELFATTNYE